jgi:hypothetical protein
MKQNPSNGKVFCFAANPALMSAEQSNDINLKTM